MHRRLLAVSTLMSAVALLSSGISPSIATGSPDPRSAAQQPSARRAPLPGRIYYAHNCDVYVARADGTHQRRLTHTSRCEGLPAASPDGSMVAFGSASPHGTTYTEIYLYVVKTGHVRRVAATGGANWLSWSPNSASIAYQYVKGRRALVRIVHPDGTGLHTLKTPFRSASSPLWSTDGSRIYFSANSKKYRNHLHGCAYEPSAVFSVGLRGGPVRLERGSKQYDSFATGVAAHVLSASLRLGRDGPEKGCLPTVKGYDVFSGNRLVLRDAWYPTYSPDKDHIAFFDTTKSQMAVANADGTHRRLLTKLPDDAFGTWGPDPAN